MTENERLKGKTCITVTAEFSDEQIQQLINQYIESDSFKVAQFEAIKVFAKMLKDEIASAIASNNNIIQVRFEKHRKKYDSAFNDDVSTMCHGKILALRGISDYIDNLVEEMVGDAE